MTTAEVRPNQRDHILDVALRLMSERGATGMSMRQLAAACGVQVAAIYHYFESKDALLAAVVAERQYGTRLIEDPLPVDPDAAVSERLRQLFHAVWMGTLDEQAIWRLLLGEGMRGEPTVLPVGQALLDLLEPASLGWIERYLPEIEHPGAVARLFVGQLLACVVQHAFWPDRDPEQLAADNADALITAVLAS